MLNIYEPMLFVGIGGTGLTVGRELESRLRDGICGPTGRDFIERYSGNIPYEPFQLPKTLQFVYLDLDQDELTRVMSGTSIEADNRQQAAAFNPGVTAYSDAANYMRAQPEPCRHWIPDSAGEPEVAPLQIGAGQVPMVGRVALFASMVNGGPAVFQAPFTTAVGRINNANAELQSLGGTPGRKTAVFVVFSVSGGTGCGTFYDVLHLLGEKLSAQLSGRYDIYPLVLMPSAFEKQMNARENRRSKMNAGPAVIDLFRLIDYQNGKRDDKKFTIHYPDARTTKAITLEQGLLQTAVLFGGSAAMGLEDVRRSMVAFMISMMSVQGPQQDGQSQSFASSFINSATSRQTTSSSGVGRQGVSAAITASLSAPVDEISDLIAGSLLTAAVGDWESATVGEDNKALIEAFLVGAGLSEMVTKTTLPTPEQDRSSKKAVDITAALNGWSNALSTQVQQFEATLNRRIGDVAGFDYLSGLRSFLDTDIFRLSWIINGNEDGANPVSKMGVAGLFNHWATSPKSTFADHPPSIDELKDRFMKGIDWNSKEVSGIIAQLTDWYEWRQARAYATTWARFIGSWRGSLGNIQSFLDRVVRSFSDHRRAQPTEYARRCGELLLPRRGVTYHLPLAGPGQSFGVFTGMIINRYADFHEIQATERFVAESMLGSNGWGTAIQNAYERGFDQDSCLREVTSVLSKEVKAAFRLTVPPRQTSAVWPPLSQLLFDMAQPAANEIDASYTQLAQELSAVLPTGIEPAGRGVLKILCAYPGGTNESVEELLKRHLNLPAAFSTDTRFEATTGDSLEITMFRDLMGLADCPEVTELAEFWMTAKDEPQPGDFLPWRRRFPEDMGRSIAFEDDVIRILHQFLNMLWDGRVVVNAGTDIATATKVTIMPHGDAGSSFTVDLRRYGNVGSLHSFVAGYEREAMRSNLVRNEVLQAFNTHVPADAQSGDGAGPSQLYVDLINQIANYRALATKNLNDLPDQSKPFGQFVYDFWHSVLDKAMLHHFATIAPFRSNHRDLALWSEKCALPDLSTKL